MPVGVAGVATVIAASAFEQTIQDTLDDIVYQRSLLSFETRHMRVEDVPMDNGTVQVLVVRVKTEAGEVVKRIPLSTVESVTIANEENHTFTIKSTALASTKGSVGSLTLRVSTHPLLMAWVNGLRALTGDLPVEPTIKDFTRQPSMPLVIAGIKKPTTNRRESTPQQGGDVHVVEHNDIKPPDDRSAWAPPPEPDMCWKFPLVLLLMTALTVKLGLMQHTWPRGRCCDRPCLALPDVRALGFLAALRHRRGRRAKAYRGERLRGAQLPPPSRRRPCPLPATPPPATYQPHAPTHPPALAPGTRTGSGTVTRTRQSRLPR